MNKMEIVYMEDVEKKTNNHKTRNRSIPTIQRTDIMLGLLSSNLNHDERARLSNLYAEITYMEKKDLKYINEIVVSSQSDLEVYEMLKRLNKRKTKKGQEA